MKYFNNLYSCIATMIFACVLAVGFIFGLILPMRPDVSNMEKRKLEEFPHISDVLHGEMKADEFLNKVTLWYADSYPGREGMLKVYGNIKGLYGFRNEQLVGGPEIADVIPTIPGGNDLPTPIPPVTDPDPGETTVTPSAENPTVSPAASEPSTEPSQPQSEVQPTSESQIATPVPTEVPQTKPGTDDVPVEKQGAVYVKGNAGYGLFYFNREAADTYINAVNRTADVLPGANVYTILVPTSTHLYLSDATIASFGGSDQAQAFNYIGGSMNRDKVTVVPIVDTLMAHTDEYIYFRTDHHWTALGAYYAYRQFTAYKGITPTPINEYQTMTFDNFLGSFYSSTKNTAMENNPDTILAYVPKSTNRFTFLENPSGNLLDWNIINDVSKYNKYNRYSCFIGGDNPFSTINNPTLTDGSSCVVVKESFGNAFVPFLVDHYQTVYVVDYRLYKKFCPDSLAAFVRTNNIQDIIYVNNADALSSRENMNALSAILEY